MLWGKINITFIHGPYQCDQGENLNVAFDHTGINAPLVWNLTNLPERKIFCSLPDLVVSLQMCSSQKCIEGNEKHK